MTNSTPIPLIRKLEPLIAVFLLFISVNLDVPPFINSNLRLARYGLILLLFLGVSIGRWQKIAYVAVQDPLPWILAGLSLISIVWSSSPARTIDEFAPLLRDSVLGLYLAIRYTPKQLMYLVAWTFGIGAFLSFILTAGIPSYGMYITEGQGAVAWSGLYLHKQYLGLYTALGAMTFLNTAASTKKYRRLSLAAFALAVVLIFLSFSKTSLLLLIISLALLPAYKLFRLRKRFKTRVVLFITSLLATISVFCIVIGNLEFIVVDTLGKNLEFNGRVPIWTLAIKKGAEKLWLGYGYAGFWHSDNRFFIQKNVAWMKEFSDDPRAFHFHNDFIEVFIQLGLIGLLLLLISFALLIARTIYLINCTQEREFFWILQFTIICFLAGISGYDILLHSDLIWALYVSMCLATALHSSRIRKKIRRSRPNFATIEQT